MKYNMTKEIHYPICQNPSLKLLRVDELPSSLFNLYQRARANGYHSVVNIVYYFEMKEKIYLCRESILSNSEIDNRLKQQNISDEELNENYLFCETAEKLDIDIILNVTPIKTQTSSPTVETVVRATESTFDFSYYLIRFINLFLSLFGFEPITLLEQQQYAIKNECLRSGHKARSSNGAILDILTAAKTGPNAYHHAISSPGDDSYTSAFVLDNT